MRRIAAASILLGATLRLCPTTSAQTAQNAQSVWYLSGRVTLDAGWPPDSPADIVVTCNGQPFIAARTDKKGDFSFPLGAGGNRSIEDASMNSPDGLLGRPSVFTNPPLAAGSGQSSSSDQQQQTASSTTAASTAPATNPLSSGSRPAGARAFAACDLQAKLPGYSSPSVILDTRRALDSLNLGTIVLRRIAPADGSPVSAAALAAPKDARKAFDKGREALRANRPEDAGRDFEKAAGLYPKYAAAWCELGKLRLDAGRLQEARQLFETAIRADPAYLEPYLTLAALQAVSGQWAALADTTGSALRMDVHQYPQAYYLNALANFHIARLDAAEMSARQAERLDPRHRFPGSWLVLGKVLLIRRQFTEAAFQLREYLNLAPRAPEADAVRSKLAEIESLTKVSAPQDPVAIECAQTGGCGSSTATAPADR